MPREKTCCVHSQFLNIRIFLLCCFHLRIKSLVLVSSMLNDLLSFIARKYHGCQSCFPLAMLASGPCRLRLTLLQTRTLARTCAFGYQLIRYSRKFEAHFSTVSCKQFAQFQCVYPFSNCLQKELRMLVALSVDIFLITTTVTVIQTDERDKLSNYTTKFCANYNTLQY